MKNLVVTDLLTRYDEGDLTTKELLGQAFSYLNSNREDIDPVLATLQRHPEKSIRELGGKLLALLGVVQTTHDRIEGAGERVNEPV